MVRFLSLETVRVHTALTFLTFCYQEAEETSLAEGSLAESLRAAAEAAVSQTGFIYDENTGLYYDHSTGFYYNSVRIISKILEIFCRRSFVSKSCDEQTTKIQADLTF